MKTESQFSDRCHKISVTINYTDDKYVFIFQDLREWQGDGVKIRKRRVKIEDCKWCSTSAVILMFFLNPGFFK